MSLCEESGKRCMRKLEIKSETDVLNKGHYLHTIFFNTYVILLKCG